MTTKKQATIELNVSPEEFNKQIMKNERKMYCIKCGTEKYAIEKDNIITDYCPKCNK